MMHDDHENWRRLSGWDEAEEVIPGCSAEWDVQCRDDAEMAGAVDIELWVHIHWTGHTLDVVWPKQPASHSADDGRPYHLRRRMTWYGPTNLKWWNIP